MELVTYHTFFLDKIEHSKDFNGDNAMQVTITFGTEAKEKQFLDYLERLLSDHLDGDDEWN